MAAESTTAEQLPAQPSSRHPAQAARRDRAAWQIAPLPATTDRAAAEAWCRLIAASHYENFSVATRLVPPRLRQHLATVYAFARWSDDLADETADPQEADRRLADWRRQLDDCFAGRAVSHPIFAALAATARETGLGSEPFADLIDAFRQDQVRTRYASRAELLDYCRRSADPVGRIVLALEGCREPDFVAMSDAICTGLQLVNFWQDLKRDRIAGRVYLPADDMRRFDVDESMLDLPAAPAPLRALVREELAWARERFASGAPLVGLAPASLRPAIRMFLGGGLAIAAAIERAGCDTLSRRPTVGRWTKLALAGRAWLATRLTPGWSGP